MNDMAIERNLQALKRLLAVLMVYIGLADDTGEALAMTDGPARALRVLGEPSTISRRVHRMICTLLRPVEAATRRLIFALAATLPAPKLPPSPLKPSRIALGLATDARAAEPRDTPVCNPNVSPRPEPGPLPRMPRFAPADPLRIKFRLRDADDVLPPFDPARFLGDPAKAYEQVPDAWLIRRVAALAAALDDLPRQARRFARWRAIAEANDRQPPLQHKFRRSSPLKPGFAPGTPPRSLPKSRWREEHHVLAETHSLARHALAHPLRRPDTS